jgi:hypothetical protein
MATGDQFPWADGHVLTAADLNRAMGYEDSIVQSKISSTETASVTDLSGTPLKFFVIKNLGPNSACINFSATASLTALSINANESMTFNGGKDGVATIYHITATGQTADLRVIGTY